MPMWVTQTRSETDPLYFKGILSHCGAQEISKGKASSECEPKANFHLDMVLQRMVPHGMAESVATRHRRNMVPQ